jgi:hypothetical protein
VTIRYGFHPLRGQGLQVIRKSDFLDEVHYVVRRVDGSPLAVAAWMTQPESAGRTIVSSGRLPVRTMIEMPYILASRQRQLSEEEPPPAPAALLPPDVKERIRQALVHCLQALAKWLREERGTGDE